jgi:poly [ADP-ribose] polymerase
MSTTQTKKYVKLIMVTADNRNKYYEMLHEGGTQFSVRYGRVESTSVKTSYPISKWEEKYREKVGKGYKDVTAFVTTEVVDAAQTPATLGAIKEAKVAEFMTLMKKYTDNLVSTTYSVKATSVTQAQVDAAQEIIDQLNSNTKKNEPKINDLLLELYTTIPRRMGDTRHYLLPNITLVSTLRQEQDNLDAMASQVAQLAPKAKKGASAKAKKETQTLLNVLGLTMTVGKVNKDIEYLVKQLTGKKIEAIFDVNKPAEDANFNKWMDKQKNKTTSTLIHGTKCTSVIPILEIGLKIRPAGNFQFSGKAYGDGNYFSEKTDKSLGYVGHDKDMVLLVYEVHTGNPFTYDGWYRGNSFSLNYKELSSRGYDSTYVKAGNGLLNSEIICYKEEQNRIKHIIWLKR